MGYVIGDDGESPGIGAVVDEYEWLYCSDPQLMLWFLRDADLLTDNKSRVFAAACYRRVWHRLEYGDLREAVEFAEQYADGLATPEDLRGNAWGRAKQSALIVLWNAAEAAFVSAEYCATVAARSLAADGQEIDRAWEHTFREAWARGCVSIEARMLADAQAPANWLAERRRSMRQEERGQTDLLRDIFGNPFHPVSIDPRWLTTNVIDLVCVIYEERAFERLPILADALMDAGCDNDDIIKHCREQRRVHVRGCCVIDLLLRPQNHLRSAPP
jgi:hypothetical protein